MHAAGRKDIGVKGPFPLQLWGSRVPVGGLREGCVCGGGVSHVCFRTPPLGEGVLAPVCTRKPA